MLLLLSLRRGEEVAVAKAVLLMLLRLMPLLVLRMALITTGDTGNAVVIGAEQFFQQQRFQLAVVI